MNTFVAGVSTGVNPNEKWQDLRQKQKLPWEHFHHCHVHKPHKHKITIPFALPYSSHFNIYFPMLHHTYVDHIQTDHIIKAENNITTNKSGISTNKTNIQKNVENIKTNASNISTNKTNIGINKSDIATNAVNIAKNAEEIAHNAANIAANKKEINDIKDVLKSNRWKLFNE